MKAAIVQGPGGLPSTPIFPRPLPPKASASSG